MLLTQLPDELPASFDRSRTYGTRGWTTFEWCSAELGAKPFSLGYAKWKLVIDVAADDGGAQRRLPTTPARMATLLADCRFTNGADSSTVLTLYEKTAVAVLGNVESLDYSGLPLVRGDAWTSPVLLAETLNYCDSLRRLTVRGALLDDEGVAELAAGLEDSALPALENLAIMANRFGARGAAALCDIFPRGVAPALKTLNISFTRIGNEGAVALAAALKMGKPALTLSLRFCDVGNEGAMAIAAALPSASKGCRVIAASIAANNRMGLAGQTALLQALEAKHGAQFMQALSVSQMSFFPWLTPIKCARPHGRWGRGMRRVFESGQLIV